MKRWAHRLDGGKITHDSIGRIYCDHRSEMMEAPRSGEFVLHADVVAMRQEVEEAVMNVWVVHGGNVTFPDALRTALALLDGE